MKFDVGDKVSIRDFSWSVSVMYGVQSEGIKCGRSCDKGGKENVWIVIGVGIFPTEYMATYNNGVCPKTPNNLMLQNIYTNEIGYTRQEFCVCYTELQEIKKQYRRNVINNWEV